MVAISLSVYDQRMEEIFRDAKFVKDPNATVGHLRTYMYGGEHPAAMKIAQRWQIVSSIRPVNISNRHLP